MRTLDEKTTACVFAAIDALTEYGPVLQRPLADTLTGSVVKNLKELRPAIPLAERRFAEHVAALEGRPGDNRDDSLEQVRAEALEAGQMTQDALTRARSSRTPMSPDTAWRSCAVRPG